MTAPSRPSSRLFRGQVVYVRCVVTVPAHERTDDTKTTVVSPCFPDGSPKDFDHYFYVPTNWLIPKTRLAGELK